MIEYGTRIKCVRLYKEGKHKIKEIMALTGIRSEQTIYRILDEEGIPRRPTRNTVMKSTISFDRETAEVIKRANPKNLSEFVCEAIKAWGTRNEGKDNTAPLPR